MRIGVRLGWLTVACVLSVTAQAEGRGTLTLTVGGGWEQGELDWNLADSDGSPNVLSELQFQDQDARRYLADLSLVVNSGRFEGLEIHLQGAVSRLQDGSALDRDWSQDNRQGLFSESRSAITGDRGREGRLLVGYRFSSEHLALTPLIGWQQRQRTLRMQSGTQIVGNADLTGLNSTYDTRWQGPWIGGAVSGQWGRLSTHVMAGAMYGEYEGEGNWNLRTDLAHPVSYRHSSDTAWLADVRLGLDWQHDRGWHLGMEAGYLTGGLEDGTDDLFFSNGTSVRSPLNEVNVSGQWWMLTAGWQWQ